MNLKAKFLLTLAGAVLLVLISNASVVDTKTLPAIQAEEDNAQAAAEKVELEDEEESEDTLPEGETVIVQDDDPEDSDNEN